MYKRTATVHAHNKFPLKKEQGLGPVQQETGAGTRLLQIPSLIAGLTAEKSHLWLRVAVAVRHSFRSNGINLLQLLFRKPDLERSCIFFQVFAALRTRDGHNILSAGQKPGKGQLGRRTALSGGQLTDLLHEVNVLLEVVSLEAGRPAAVIIFPKVFEAFDLTG